VVVAAMTQTLQLLALAFAHGIINVERLRPFSSMTNSLAATVTFSRASAAF